MLALGIGCRQNVSKKDTNQTNNTVSPLTGYTFNSWVPGATLIGLSHVASSPNLDHQTLDDGVATLMRLNVKSAFFYLTPDFRSKYVQQDFGASNPQSLSELATLAPYRRAFAGFDNIILTCTADGFSSKDLNIRDHFLTDAEYAANKKEFFDFTTYLMKSYNGTKKRFILKNWEGDWLLLGGYDENADVPDARVSNFVRWLQSTQDGIAQARSSAETNSDVRVDFALEMNRLEIVRKGKRNTFLGSVIPLVPSDWVAYSSWETISNRGGPQDPDSIYKTVVADLNDIKQRSGRPLFVSEFGYVESGNSTLQAARTEAAIRGFKDAGIPLAFYWNTYESDYGVLRTDGKRTPNGAFNALAKEAMMEQVNESRYFSSPQATNVTAAYWQVLGRKPAGGEFDYWVKNKAASDASLIHKYFAESDEAMRVVAQTYQKYAGSEPDEGSKQYQRSVLANGGTISDIASALYSDHLNYNTKEQTTETPRVSIPAAPTAAPPTTQTEVTTNTGSGCVGSSLSPGHGLNTEQWLCSDDRRFLLSMQSDGNLVIYQGSKALWASNTGGSGATTAQFQNDGNFVIYAGSKAVWTANVGGKGAEKIVMQGDGNLLILKGDSLIWASHTGGH